MPSLSSLKPGRDATARLLPLLVVAGILCFIISSADAGQPRPNPARFATTKGAPVPDNPDAEPGEILVKFKPNRAKQGLAKLRAKSGLPVGRHKQFRTPGWHLVKVKSSRKLKDIIAAYREDPDVLYAEPNYRIRAAVDQLFPNDPYFYQLWGMHKAAGTGGLEDADIDAPEAWARLTTSDVLVAVLDTGVDYNHVDLAANMWTNTGEIDGNDEDDDNNGYVDDVRGWDFYNNDNDPMDDHSHGTHVSGTVGAIGNNATGVAGVCWNVKIMPVKFLNSSGTGSLEGALDAIEYATAMGARITNNSWAFPPGAEEYSQALYDAIDAAGQAGCLFVTVAGNDYGNNNDAVPVYPGSYDLDNIIAVSGTTHWDRLGSFSNVGATTVDLGAPGNLVYSTTLNNSYGLKTGTSMASPHVAGSCALVWTAAGSTATCADIKAAIFDGTDPLEGLTGTCVTGGRLNLYNSLGLVWKADAGADSFGYESRSSQAYVVQLNGTGSRGAASYSWQQIDGVPVVLRNAESSTPNFDAPQWDGSTELSRTEALLRFRLTINEGELNEDADEVEVYIRIPGDANGDDAVNAFDLAMVRTVRPEADFNGDGVINAFDVVILRQNAGRRRTVD